MAGEIQRLEDSITSKDEEKRKTREQDRRNLALLKENQRTFDVLKEEIDRYFDSFREWLKQPTNPYDRPVSC